MSFVIYYEYFQLNYICDVYAYIEYVEISVVVPRDCIVPQQNIRRKIKNIYILMDHTLNRLIFLVKM